MDRGRRCGGRALGIVVGIAALVLVMAGGAGALSNSGGGRVWVNVTGVPAGESAMRM